MFAVDVSNETLPRPRSASGRPGTPHQPGARAARPATSWAAISSPAMSTASAASSTSRPEGESRRFAFEVPAQLAAYIASKGSVALDGISLTVNEVDGDRFGVNIIPHTLTHDHLGGQQAGRHGQSRGRHAWPATWRAGWSIRRDTTA